MNGLCEIAVIMEPHNGVGVNSISIYSEKWIAIIPRKHPILKNKKEKITMEQIADYELIIPSRESRLSEIGEWFKDANKIPKVRCKVAHVLSAYELTRQGMGIAIFPASISNILNSNEVVIKEFEDPAPTASYILIWNRNRTLSHAATEFLKYVNNLLERKDGMVTHT